jgi:GNAT superfamily N-acetyltransferase
MVSNRSAETEVAIHRLAQHPELASETAALMMQIWPDHYGPEGVGDAPADVQSRIEDDRAAVAMQDDSVVATVALSEMSFGAKGEGPWLVGLCTDPDYRGQGIASALITWTMGLARQQGRTALFTTTRDAAGIVKRLGWRKVRTITDESGTWSVWTIDLAKDSPG